VKAVSEIVVTSETTWGDVSSCLRYFRGEYAIDNGMYWAFDVYFNIMILSQPIKDYNER
jgi:hypothetical protein